MAANLVGIKARALAQFTPWAGAPRSALETCVFFPCLASCVAMVSVYRRRMTRNGHRLTGLALGLLAAPAMIPHLGFAAWLLVPSTTVGGNIPDGLEWLGRERWCEHRTITHWWPFWLALGVVSATHLPSWIAIIGLGLAIGAASHLLVDWPNPTGIPTWHPWRRHSLRLWRSGEHEVPIVLLLFGLVGLAYWLGFSRMGAFAGAMHV